MKTTYLIWKDPSCGGVNPEWQEISGQDFLALVRAPEHKGRRFIKLCGVSGDGGDGDVVMESTERQYAAWKKEKNCADYLRRCNKDFTVLSYHSLESDDGGYGEELLGDTGADIEDEYLRLLDKQTLRAALAQLSEDERRLIAYLYLADEQGTERGYIELTGLAKTTVHDMKVRCLKKLKKFFEK